MVNSSISKEKLVLNALNVKVMGAKHIGAAGWTDWQEPCCHALPYMHFCSADHASLLMGLHAINANLSGQCTQDIMSKLLHKQG